MADSVAFFTDRYELTMVDAALRHGTADRECVFEVFTRSLPAGRRYGIVAGTGRLLDMISRFRFTTEQLDWLSAENIVHVRTLDWLADYRFTGDIWGYREGEVYFPNSPVLGVRGSFAEAVLLETLILSVLNYDCAVASAASRMSTASGERPIIEMGSRRSNESAAVAAARAAYIGGFAATSNLAAGIQWGVPTLGTAAHAFTLLHNSELDAFHAQLDAFGPATTLLIDTYDIHEGVRHAIASAGTGLGAVRIDSGELPSVVHQVRNLLDELGATDTKITVTSDLDEYKISGLSTAPVDSFGVGTSVVTGSGAPAAGMVYKLVARREGDGWVPVAKTSAGKGNVGGKKWAHRPMDPAGVAISEAVDIGTELVSKNGRVLTLPLMISGVAQPQFLGKEATQNAREHRKMALGELPAEAFALDPGTAAIPTVFTETR